MREIKFRAKALDDWMYFTLQQLINGSAVGFEEYNLKDWCQHTGLKDKNGVEIYQGDLLKFTNPEGESFYNGIAEVKAETCGYKFEPDHKLTQRENWKYDSTMFWHDFETDVEVIGNIFENPTMPDDKVEEELEELLDKSN